MPKFVGQPIGPVGTLPVAMAAGSATVSLSGSSGSLSINLPTSRFSAAPIVVASIHDGGQFRLGVSSVTTSAFTVTVVHAGGQAPETVGVSWIAIQMTGGSANG